MIPASAIVAALEGLGYRLFQETATERQYGKAGRSERIVLPKADSLDHADAVALLRQAGISEESIASIVAPHIERNA